MAEIPVERKTGGLPWWLPLLLLLLLIPLLFLLFRGCSTAPANTNTNGNGNANRAVSTTNTNAMNNNTAVVTNTNTGVATTGGNTNSNSTTAGGMISDINIFGTTTDKASLVGRTVDLQKIKVQRVLSDKVFTVLSGSNEMFALLGDNLNAGAKEKQIKIEAGQVLNLAGDFRTVPTGETKAETQKGSLSVSQKEYAQMKGQQIYLHTSKVEDAK